MSNKNFDSLMALFDASSEGLWEMSPSGEMSFYNKNFYKNFNISLENSTLDEWIELIHPADKATFGENVEHQIGSGTVMFVSEYRVMNRKNQYVWIEAKGVTKYDDSGEYLYMVGAHQDITARKIDEIRIFDLAFKDKMTGLFNRSKLIETLADHPDEFIVTSIGFNQMEVINEIYGHDISARILQVVAEVLNETFKQSHLLFKMEYYDFAILFHKRMSNEFIKSSIDSCIKSIRRKTEQLIKGIELQVFAGLSDRTNDYDSAKLAMSYAKKNKIENCILYNDEIRYDVNRTNFIETEMRSALTAGEFEMVFQPILDSCTGEVSCLEALMRWHNTEYGEIYPDEFIPIAERTMNIIDLGFFSVHESLKAFDAITNTVGKRIPVSVNASVLQLLDPNFTSKLTDLVSVFNIENKELVIEVTESITLEKNKVAKDTLECLIANGFIISLDDFGKGYSSLNILFTLDCGKLKLDKQIIWLAASDPEIESFLSALTILCHSKDIKVVAEGIETTEMSSMAKRIGIDFEQGYFHSKPLPLSELIKFLTST
ncbi:MAG: EAL domain-containing protein [Clostridiales bacterium]|nr:EAL domain-containing protein [Clostridiales bacterium]